MPPFGAETGRNDEVVCAADVPAEEWAEYERMADELGEPPDTPLPRDVELV